MSRLVGELERGEGFFDKYFLSDELPWQYDKELWNGLVETFLASAYNIIIILKQGLYEGNAKKVKIQARELMGASAVVGIGSIRLMAFKIAKAAEQQKLTKAQSTFQKLELEMDRVRVMLTDYS